MTFYTGLTILTELFMLAMSIHVLRYSGFTGGQKAWFLLTFGTIMLCSAAEYAVHCGVYDPKFALPLTVVTVLQFSAAPMLGILFSGALGLSRMWKVALIFLGLNLTVEALAVPFGWVFYFDQSGYSRGAYFIIYEIFYFVSLLYLAVNMVRVGRRFRHRDTVTIAMILVVLAAGIVPMTLFQIHITYMAIAISASLCYIYYNDLIQQDIQLELVTNQERMSRLQERIISGLANLIENRDTETGEHVVRTSRYVRALSEFAREDGVYSNQLSDHFIALMHRVAPLHDVGKIVVPDEILKKPGRLTEPEFDQIKRHASEGGRVIHEVLGGVADDEYLSVASEIAACHHERWDGRGYPNGLSGEEIPLSARIMAVADVFDALVSKRCYKAPMSPEEALGVMLEEAGTHFDPNLIRVLTDHRDEWIDLSRE